MRTLKKFSPYITMNVPKGQISRPPISARIFLLSVCICENLRPIENEEILLPPLVFQAYDK